MRAIAYIQIPGTSGQGFGVGRFGLSYVRVFLLGPGSGYFLGGHQTCIFLEWTRRRSRSAPGRTDDWGFGLRPLFARELAQLKEAQDLGRPERGDTESRALCQGRALPA